MHVQTHDSPLGTGKEQVCTDGVWERTEQVRHEKEPRHPGRLLTSKLLASAPLSILDTRLPQASGGTPAALIALVNPTPCSSPGSFKQGDQTIQGHRATLFPCPLQSLYGAHGDLAEALLGRVVPVITSLGNPVCPWRPPFGHRPGSHVSHRGAPASSLGVTCSPVKGELRSEIRFWWVHNVLLSSYSIWSEEEITDFGLWAVVGQKPHLALGFWPK